LNSDTEPDGDDDEAKEARLCIDMVK